MTHEQLIKLIEQSAPDFTQYNEFFCTLHDFKRFAALVAAAEREACAATVKDYLRVARFDERHVGLGDIRLTIGDQETLEASIRARGKA
jgi:hypothetical protein